MAGMEVLSCATRWQARRCTAHKCLRRAEKQAYKKAVLPCQPLGGVASTAVLTAVAGAKDGCALHRLRRAFRALKQVHKLSHSNVGPLPAPKRRGRHGAAHRGCRCGGRATAL